MQKLKLAGTGSILLLSTVIFNTAVLNTTIDHFVGV